MDRKQVQAILCKQLSMMCTCICKAWGFYFLCIFVIKYSKIQFITIFYKEIILKTGFGQAYCKDILKRILNKFISYFYEFLIHSYENWHCKEISGIFNRKKDFGKRKNHARRAARGHALAGHRTQDGGGGTIHSGEPTGEKLRAARAPVGNRGGGTRRGCWRWNALK
jgi:hypothetical protein